MSTSSEDVSNTKKENTEECKSSKSSFNEGLSNIFNNIGKSLKNIANFFVNVLTNKYLLFVICVILVSIVVNFLIITKYCKGKNISEIVSSRMPNQGTRDKMIKWTFIISLILMIVGFIVFLIMYWLEYYNTNPILVRNINAKKGPIVVKNNRLLKSFKDVAYSYSFWMYVDNWSYRYNKPKWLLYKCKSPKNDEEIPLSSPTIVMNQEEPKITVSINTTTDDDGNINEMITTPPLELQQWNHIVLTVRNQNVRIYCNGKLCVGKRLIGTIVLNDDDLNIVPYGGYSGMLHNLQYFNYEIGLDKVSSLYSRKPKSIDIENEVSKFA